MHPMCVNTTTSTLRDFVVIVDQEMVGRARARARANERPGVEGGGDGGDDDESANVSAIYWMSENHT